MAIPTLVNVSPPPVLYRPEAGAHALGISRARLYQLLRDGAIESVRIGRSRRIPHDALTAYVARLRVEQEQEQERPESNRMVPA
ncbi:DNA-binding protein, excisionase family [Frankia sp. Hr75.2]|nr:DNA-binding protein, excisionase family [Frankia sp. Hr75.2]